VSLVSGYFDPNTKTLAVAAGRKDWLEVLVHESCHMDQFLDPNSIWHSGGVEAVDQYFDWMSGKDVREFKEQVLLAGLLELDCESRTVTKIEQFNLPIDIKTYIKKANAYTQFYLYSISTRKWHEPSNKPYDNQAIVSACPDYFDFGMFKQGVMFPHLYNIFKEQIG
jgi:hypothetical protein